MRLKDRPWKLLAGALFGTIAVIFGAADLLDGTVHLRHRAISLEANPVRFGFYVLALLGAAAAVVLGWCSLIDEWNRNYTPRWRPRFDDPSRRRDIGG